MIRIVFEAEPVIYYAQGSCSSVKTLAGILRGSFYIAYTGQQQSFD